MAGRTRAVAQRGGRGGLKRWASPCGHSVSFRVWLLGGPARAPRPARLGTCGPDLSTRPLPTASATGRKLCFRPTACATWRFATRRRRCRRCCACRWVLRPSAPSRLHVLVRAVCTAGVPVSAPARSTLMRPAPPCCLQEMGLPVPNPLMLPFMLVQVGTAHSACSVRSRRCTQTCWPLSLAGCCMGPACAGIPAAWAAPRGAASPNGAARLLCALWGPARPAPPALPALPVDTAACFACFRLLCALCRPTRMLRWTSTSATIT